MSATTSLVKQLMSERSSRNSSDSTDAASSTTSLSEVKAAAKEGTAEALAEYHQATDDAEVVEDETEDVDDESKGGSWLKRSVLLALVAVYLLRRYRSSQSTDDLDSSQSTDDL